MLTKREVQEIVAFDRQRRMCGNWDARPFGTLTGAAVPTYTESGNVAHGRAAGAGEKPPTRKTLRYNYIQPMRHRAGARPEVRVVHVAVRLDRQHKPVVKEVARIRTDSDTIEYRDMGYHGLGGWIVYWDRADYATKCINAWRQPPGLGEWERERYRRGGALTFPWHETVNPQALKGTKYEWCQWPGTNGLVDWLKLYRADPRIELLAKMGLTQLCTPAGVKAASKPEVRAYIRANLEELRHYRTWTVKDFCWAAKRGLPIIEGVRHYQIVSEFKYVSWQLRDAHLKLDYARVGKMLPKWRATVKEYVRYLEYALTAGLDLRCAGVLYPPVGRGETSFAARLERMEAAAALYERRARRKNRLEQAKLEREAADLMAARKAEIAAFQLSLDKSAVVDLGKGVTCVLAKDQKTLLEEGKKMNNCVGMGTYGHGVLLGSKLILMFRKNGKPFVDAEIDRQSWRVKQCYARGNSQAPEEYHAASARVAKFLKAQFKKAQKAAKARRKAS